MGDVINLEDRRFSSSWREVFTVQDDYNELHVYVDDRTGEVEVFQVNVDCKANRTVLSASQAKALVEALRSRV